MSGDLARTRRPNDFLSPHSPKRRRDCPSLMPPSPASSPACSSSSSTSGSASSSSPPPAIIGKDAIQFFLRTDRTISVVASPDDTIGEILARHCPGGAVGRLIFCGRQLGNDRTLAECGVYRDCTLYFASRLQSTRFFRAHQIASEINASVSAVMDGCKCSLSVPYLVRQFLSITTGDVLADHLEVFLNAGVPNSLVRLYALRNFHPDAKEAIRCFVTPDVTVARQELHHRFGPVLIAFCQRLAVAVGMSDPLYVECRSRFADIVSSQDWRTASHNGLPEDVVALALPFAKEITKAIVSALSLDRVVLHSDLDDFSKFLLVLRREARRQMFGSDPVNVKSYNCSSWIYSLHDIYMEVLKKVDDCFKGYQMDLSLTGGKTVGNGDSNWVRRVHILSILTELNDIADIFADASRLLHFVLSAHQGPLDMLVRHANRNHNLQWLSKCKELLGFEARRNLVLLMLPEGNDDYGQIHEMLIDRSKLLSESFEYISGAKPHELRAGIFMEFKNEEATGPGVLREWFCHVSNAIFSPQQVLFSSCLNDKRRFFVNPTSAVDPLHLKYYVFSGRVIGLALMHRVPIGIVFDRLFFLQLAGKDISLEDIVDADPCLYASCKTILEMDTDLVDSDSLGLTFIRETEVLGERKIIELCPGGKDIIVNSKNRDRYIKLIIQDRFVNSTTMQLSHFAQGFGDILVDSKLQKSFFQCLDLEDFDRILGGTNSLINIGEWKQHTEYKGFKEKDRIISWFWKAVERMNIEQQRQLLFFWTSVKYLPVDGFSGLPSKLCIYKSVHSQDHLPSSHTCFYRLCLPAYSSQSMMQSRLNVITQEHTSCSFGTW